MNKQPDWTPVVGDGVTICFHSDRKACTVVEGSAGGRTFWIQEDEATLDQWKPEFIPGGFAGHCVNNHAQVYQYRPNPKGLLHRIFLRKDGHWRTNDRQRVIPGRHHFHDYNF